MCAKKVYVSRHTGGKKYHTDPDCRALKGNEREPLGQLTDEWSECSYCSGEYDHQGGPSEIYMELAYGK